MTQFAALVSLGKLWDRFIAKASRAPLGFKGRRSFQEAITAVIH